MVFISPCAHSEATPQAAKGGAPGATPVTGEMEAPETVPATDEELASVGRVSKASSKQPSFPAPTSPADSLPSTSSKTSDVGAFCPNTWF